MPSDPLSEAMAAMSQFLVADASLGDTLTRVVEIAARSISSAEFVGMTMLDDRGKPSTTVFTDPSSPEIDQAQYSTGQGPCLDAWREQRVVRLDDLRALDAGQPYEAFVATALEHGIHSTLSMPLVAAGKGIGAMNLYASAAGAFTADDEDLAGVLATTSAVVLANASAYWEAFQLSSDLRTAMDSRAVIEQAKGFLMATTPGLDADGAFEVLTRASQRENVKLREVARRIVEQRRSSSTATSPVGARPARGVTRR